MSLAAGDRLGPYEILAPLGAGGMGEVYRARDSKLDREVAVKVLPEHLIENPAVLARFEREAKAVAALSHPGILAIHDFGTDQGRAYAVMELLEGETLRETLARGAPPLRKAVDIGAQIARGLAAAHEKGVVHRDLKPENLFLLRDGRVKILDFGLARVRTHLPEGGTNSPTAALPTDPGTVMGTVGYMSPEQVRGDEADHRSDIFSLGCVLYEMLSGKRAFARDTAAETLTATLKEDPPGLRESGLMAPPSLELLVGRCLEKRREERFQSARDLAFALETVLTPSGRSGGAVALPFATRAGAARAVRIALAAAVVGAALAAGFGLGRGSRSGPPAADVAITRLTFERGTIWGARFAPDGRAMVYGAAWSGQPIRLFTTSADTPEPLALELPDAHILSISSKGELAVSVGHRYDGWMGAGTLARAPLRGGGARPVIEGVREADWTPDGSDLALVRRVGVVERLEFPAGKVLYETSGYISHIRFSPRGDRIAFADHSIWADDNGSVALVDLAGQRTTLTRKAKTSLRGLAWSPAGDEVWFTSSNEENGLYDRHLSAVDMSGRERLMLAGLTDMTLFDVSRDGRLLLGRETQQRHIEGLLPGRTTPRDFSIRQASIARDIFAPDGRFLVVTNQDVPGYAALLRPTDGSPSIHLGAGDGFGLSPDGRWVLTLSTDLPQRILLHPTGTGQGRELANPEGLIVDSLRWLPDARILVFAVAPKDGHRRGYTLDPAGGPVRAFTGPDVEPAIYWAMPVSPDGTRVVARDSQRRLAAYRVDGGEPEPIPGVSPLDLPIEWSADGAALFVARQGELPWRIRRHELATGRETPLTEIAPAVVDGVRLSQIFLAPDGRSWVHSYSRLLTDLYLVAGVR